MGVEPGFSDVAARYAADHLFSRIDEIGVRDGADLVIDGYDFAPTFSIWTTIEECLNPPIVYERDRGWFTTEPFSEPEVFTFPEGIGPLGCVNVEHEEVVLMPRWLDVGRVTFKYGLGDEFIDVLRTLHKLGLDGKHPSTSRGARCRRATSWRPCCPTRPSSARTCAAHVRRHVGEGHRAGRRGPREIYLYHVVDNAWSMREFGHQAVVWQTAVMPAVAIELLATGGGRAPVCSAPRRCRPTRSSSCSTTRASSGSGTTTRLPGRPGRLTSSVAQTRGRSPAGRSAGAARSPVS